MASMTVRNLFFQLQRLMKEGKVNDDTPVRMYVPSEAGHGTVYDADHIIGSSGGQILIAVERNHELYGEERELDEMMQEMHEEEDRQRVRELVDSGAEFDEATATYMKEGSHYDAEGNLL